MNRVSSTFTVTRFDPQPHDTVVTTALPVGYVLMRKEFSGAIEGWAQTQFVYAFDDASQTGSYVALESFTGSIDGHEGTCNLIHSASTGVDLPGGRGNEYLSIVPASGTGGLAGLTGTGSIVVDPDGTHHLHLELPDGWLGATVEPVADSAPHGS